MTWVKGLAAAGLAAALVAGCSERKAEDRGERASTATERATDPTGASAERDPGDRTRDAAKSAEATAERAGERTEGALERGGDKVAGAGREVAAGAEQAGQEIAGTVKRVTEDTLELDDREIRIGEDTEFYRDGTRIERDEIRPGDEIRAAFDEAGDELKAKRVEVQRKMQ